MRDFLNAMHDYPDESATILATFVVVVWLIIMYKLYNDKL